MSDMTPPSGPSGGADIGARLSRMNFSGGDFMGSAGGGTVGKLFDQVIEVGVSPDNMANIINSLAEGSASKAATFGLSTVTNAFSTLMTIPPGLGLLSDQSGMSLGNLSPSNAMKLGSALGSIFAGQGR